MGGGQAIHLMVQPTVARGFMADPLAADTGFLPRFLMCEPQSAIGTRLHANAKENALALASIERRLGDILATPMPINPETGGLQLRCLDGKSAATCRLTIRRFARGATRE
jgi:hypothetical protein